MIFEIFYEAPPAADDLPEKVILHSNDTCDSIHWDNPKIEILDDPGQVERFLYIGTYDHPYKDDLVGYSWRECPHCMGK